MISITRSGSRAFATFVIISLLTAFFFFVHGMWFNNLPIPFGLYNALVLLTFSTLVTESYFTKPNDVIANSTSLLVLAIPLFPFVKIYLLGIQLICVVAFVALAFAVISNALFAPQEDANSNKQKTARGLKTLAIKLGSGRALFGTIGALLLLNEREAPSPYFVSAAIFILLFLVFDVAKLADGLRRSQANAKIFGRIIGIKGDNLAIGASHSLKGRVGQRARIALPEGMFDARVISQHRLHSESRLNFVLSAQSERQENDPRLGEFELYTAENANAAPVGLVKE